MSYAGALSTVILLPVLLAIGRGRFEWKVDRLLSGLTTIILLGGALAALVTAVLSPTAHRFILWDVGSIWGMQPDALAFGFLLDRVGLVMVALVGVVGAATTAFAGRYLVGDPGRGRFMVWFAVTVAAAQVLVLSVNLAQLALVWLVISAGLHRLLVHHGERVRAQQAARMKFVISRIGDLALLMAMAVLLPAAGTLDLVALAALAGSPALAGAAPLAVIGLMIAAMCKSAQFPMHVWLPDILEASTPVSALMHAGIINAGGFLLIRCSSVMISVQLILDALLVIGLITAVLGVLAMWAQSDVKKALAWSTVGQMGFMVLQCGLGAFAAALIHLIGHAGYKAHAFLRSGSPSAAMAPPPTAAGGIGAALAVYLIAAAAAVALVLTLQQDGQTHAGGPLLALAIGLALAQVWTAGAGSLAARTCVVIALALAAVPLLSMVHAWLGLPIAPEPFARGFSGALIGGVVAVALIGLAIISVLLPWLALRLPALRIHARDGWYCGFIAERLIRRILPLPTSTAKALS